MGGCWQVSQDSKALTQQNQNLTTGKSPHAPLEAGTIQRAASTSVQEWPSSGEAPLLGRSIRR